MLIAILITSYFLRNKLPEVGKVLPEMSQEPIQTEIVKESFTFEYRGREYKVIPQANYEIWGMVVTHNNIRAWYNFYHDKNSVNVKDVCVIWGNNIFSEAYTAMNFKSGEWTCYPDWKYPLQRELIGLYQDNKLSNNHLLSADPEVIKKINKIKIGDQVHIKGMLADYGDSSLPEEYYRRTSLSRDDTNQTSRSGGACEVMYVEEIEILKSDNRLWYSLYEFSKIGIIFIIILQSLLFFITTFVKSKKLKNNFE